MVFPRPDLCLLRVLLIASLLVSSSSSLIFISPSLFLLLFLIMVFPLPDLCLLSVFDDKLLVTASFLYLAFGDALAALFGKAYGKHKI